MNWNEAHHSIGPATEAAIKDLLLGADGETEIEQADLWQFLVGSATPEVNARVIRRLSRSRRLRLRATVLKEILRELSAAAVPSEPEENGFRSFVTRSALGAAASTAVVRQFCIEAGWGGLVHETADLARQAQNTLAALGRGWLLSRSVPRFSHVRAAVADEFYETQLGGSMVSMKTVLDGTGRLTVTIDLAEQWETLSGSRLALEIRDPGGSGIPLAESLVDQREWSIEFERFEQITGIGKGIVSPDMFRLSVDGTGELETARPILICEVDGGPPEILSLVTHPRFANGALELLIQPPTGDVSRLQGYALEIRYLMPNVSVPLGRTVFDFGSSQAMSISIPAPGFNDAAIECPSVLCARIVPA